MITKPPIPEVMKAKEGYFNKLVQIVSSLGANNNPFAYFINVSNFIEEVYSKGYESGYRQKELEVIADNGE
jgi:hypothetical protein